MVRFIFNLGSRDHVGPEELHKINWLDTYHRVNQLKLNHMHDIYYKNGPNYMLDNISRCNTIHSYNTRGSSSNFFIPSVRGNCKASFFYTGTKDWNNLPNNIKSTICKKTFKDKVKTHLDNEMFKIEAEVFFYY